MSVIEKIVPPVDLCSKIPTGSFSDSALVWCFDGDFWHVECRETSFYNSDEMIPAPTLQEIMADLPGDITIVNMNRGVLHKIGVDTAEHAFYMWFEIQGTGKRKWK